MNPGAAGAREPLKRLDLSVRFIKGVGPRRAAALEGLGIRTVQDLVSYYPFRYYDRRVMVPLAQLRLGAPATVQGVVTSIRSYRTSRRRMAVVEVGIGDGEGRAVLVWFNQPYREKEFRIGDAVVAAGKVQEGRPYLAVEEYELLEEGKDPLHAAGLVPSYRAAEGIGRRQLRTLVRTAVAEAGPLMPEVIPEDIRRRRGLAGIGEALAGIHAPESPEAAESARRRLAYEEFFALQAHLAVRRRRLGLDAPGRVITVSESVDFRIRSLFPFKLTGAQDKAVAQIRADLASGRPMNRLLQGDVGSGKTAVAAYALLAAVGRKMQAALMAPTEVLAEQHVRTLRPWLERSRVRWAFLSGGGGAERTKLVKAIAAGEVDLVIGTHAIIQRDVAFKDLGLVVIDEQQKFGVLQRAALGRKGERPHVLVMTATPIPRTLVLTLFGDLDLTVLDEMPPGRREVRTVYVASGGRGGKMAAIREQLREGRQAYFVYPLVDDSDKLALKSAMKMFEELRREFREFRVALLHGRMKPEEKEAAMEEFRSGRAQVLVSTLVIEVGVDVPNASLMVIDHAERYGLAQLHQLRGRIGRGPYASTCLLFGESNERVEALTATNDGFKIAEADLRLRGPGELLGTRQSGIPDFRAARLGEDLPLLEQAREDAFALVERDPTLASIPALAARVVQGGRSLLHVG